MFRPEMKQPKNAAGMILITAATIIIFLVLEGGLSWKAGYIAAALYVVGVVLVVIPGRAADPEDDHESNDRG